MSIDKLYENQTQISTKGYVPGYVFGKIRLKFQSYIFGKIIFAASLGFLFNTLGSSLIRVG